MKNKIGFWFVVILATTIYGIMLTWSLPKIIHMAGGLVPFDLRPSGYSFDEAKAFLTALDAQGTDFYLNVQQKLDTAFPALEALAIAWAIVLLTPSSWKKWSYILALPIIIGMVFDYLENAATKVLLQAGADGITPKLVATASTNTVIKSIFVSIGLVILLAMIVMWFVRRRATQSSKQN